MAHRRKPRPDSGFHKDAHGQGGHRLANRAANPTPARLAAGLRISALALLLGSAQAVELRVSDPGAFESAVSKAAPGDDIVLRDGVWTDADLVLKARGSAGKPVTLRAATPGGVVLTGRSRLRIAGEHLVISGLWFSDPAPNKGGDLISFRADSKSPAMFCRLTQCAVTQGGDSKNKTEQKWVSLYGTGNRVDHCLFEGKTSRGTLLVAWLDGSPAEHRIERNRFGSRPRLGRNGGEIIRIGDSESSMQSARCIVADNHFERCDGEVECISNKSCDNIYRGNVFRECQGTLTLRHGNGCAVEQNWFFGNHRPQTGGIRVIGEGHRVAGNYLDSLEGEDARAAICVMNGIGSSPLNGYFQVKNALVSGNVVLDCEQSLVIGHGDEDAKADQPPVGLRIEGNIFRAPGRRIVRLVDARAGVTWNSNVLWGAEPGLPQGEGRDWREPVLTKDPSGIRRPALDRGVRPENFREWSRRQPVAREDTGPSWRR